MNYKVLDAVWFTPPVVDILFDVLTGISQDFCIGIVAVKSSDDGDWKCYIGYGSGTDETADGLRIAAHGMPLGSKDAACGFFSQFDPEKFAY